MTKICGRCNAEKPLTEFNKKNKDRYQPYCRDCNKEYLKEHYHKNKQYYVDKAQRTTLVLKRKNTLNLFKYYKSNPCVDCGENDPVVLDSDHLSDKEFNISQMINRFSWRKIEKELSKCETRCANCHRRKTAHQFKWYEFLD